jgi:transcriptional regulator with XRE-family HTH domain
MSLDSAYDVLGGRQGGSVQGGNTVWSYMLAASLLAVPGAGLAASGTGGSLTSHTLLHKGAWVYDATLAVSSSESATQGVAETPSAQLNLVREALGLSITDLASLLGVTRPTIYAWIQGKQEPKPEMLARIQELYVVAQAAEALALPRMNRLVRRPLASGPSLLVRLQRGDADAEAALMELAEMASREESQRQQSRASFAEPGSAHETASRVGRPVA